MAGDEIAAALRQDFLDGMSYAAATVNVVTTDGPAGRAGMTVSAMSAVSADTPKPSLLICINSAASGAAAIAENGCFCVNILRDDQAHISDLFAGRSSINGEARFGGVSWEAGKTSAPVLTDALVSFDCQLTNNIIVGTHHVFFGEVQHVENAKQGAPLLYANRAYGTPQALESKKL